MGETTWFRKAFLELTGHEPFPWQERMFRSFLCGHIPKQCDIPTGLGKTSIIHIWLLAMSKALSGGSSDTRLPRRLVYIVDRRVVVDQATDEAEQICDKLAASRNGSALQEVIESLARCGTYRRVDPLVVSTLRGQHADNYLWQFDPSRAAVVIGTVDMIGSRLLFSGYGGLGRYRRSLHAGLLAQDVLLVFDEAHLTPAFTEALGAILEQIERTPCLRPFHIMLLSATLPPSDRQGEREVFKLTNDDMADRRVVERLEAKKTIRFIQANHHTASTTDSDGLKLYVEQICSEALGLSEGSRSVVILVSTVKMVNEVATRLRERLPAEFEGRVLSVTGEMRGKERDDLMRHPVMAAFAPFRPRNPGNAPAFLVATSCVEVGINFDADHAVCDLVPIERIIQRVGRVNRFGDGNAQIRIVLDRDLRSFLRESEPNIRLTFAALSRLRKVGHNGRDASPEAFIALRECGKLPGDAFTPDPPSPPLDEARLDDWAMTSLSAEDYPRPQVSYWLRGVVADQSLYTWFCWRADLVYAANAQDAAEMARAFPLAPQEVAQVNTVARGADLVKRLAQHHGDVFTVVLSAAGEWRARRLNEVANDDQLISQLAYATVYLPASVGGLVNGQPDISTEAFDNPVVDAVDEDRWVRLILQETDRGVAISKLLANGDLDDMGLFAPSRLAIRDICQSLGAKLVYISGKRVEGLGDIEADTNGQGVTESSSRVAYLQRRNFEAQAGEERDLPSLTEEKVLLRSHLETTAAVGTRLTSLLHLPRDLGDAVIRACEWHDAGKNRPWWQASIGNANGEPLAKSDEPIFDHDINRGFRHEFGSLLDATEDSELAKHPHRDLILHLIACHHGWARPTFEPTAYDRSRPTPTCAQAAREAALRFVTLQHAYGWWQLAYLEALVKCADAIASSNPHWSEP